MFDIIYDYILNTFLGSTLTTPYYEELALLLTHATIVLLFIVQVNFVLWFFKLTARIIRW